EGARTRWPALLKELVRGPAETSAPARHRTSYFQGTEGEISGGRSVTELWLGRDMLIVPQLYNHLANGPREGELAPSVVEAYGRECVPADRQAVARQRVGQGAGDRDVAGAHGLVVDVQRDGAGSALAVLEIGRAGLLELHAQR